MPVVKLLVDWRDAVLLLSKELHGKSLFGCSICVKNALCRHNWLLLMRCGHKLFRDLSSL